MPCRPKNVRAEDRAIVEAAIDRVAVGVRRPEPEAPFGAVIILRLHGAEPTNGVDGGIERGADEALAVETTAYEVAVT